MVKIRYTYLGQEAVAWLSFDDFAEMSELPGFTAEILYFRFTFDSGVLDLA